ncbi:MAG: DoxX family protein [Acidimicrobiales bacterium]
MDETNLALLILRATIGLMIIPHGYSKIFLGGKLKGTASWFDSMGMRPGAVHARLAAASEIGAGVLLTLGLLTTFGAAALIGVMVVALWTTHRKNGFFILKEGWEYVSVIALVALVVATLGPGEWSLDEALDISGDLDGWTGFWVALVVGAGGGLAQLAVFFRPPADA